MISKGTKVPDLDFKFHSKYIVQCRLQSSKEYQRTSKHCADQNRSLRNIFGQNSLAVHIGFTVGRGRVRVEGRERGGRGEWEGGVVLGRKGECVSE